MFAWLGALSVLPALAVLALALFVGARSLGLVGTLGPWQRVADSGRELIDAAAAVPGDTALDAAAARHRDELSQSLVQANRWSFLETRLIGAAPAVIGVVVLALVFTSLVVSRRLARQLASPIDELVVWAGRLGRGEPLPPEAAARDSEPDDFDVLRGALRHASVEIETARRRDLEAERTRAWGEMARRVAHEMKNPLTPLRLAAHQIAKHGGGTPALAEAATVVREETDRLDELARGFASLGRPAPGPATEVDLAEMLASLIVTDVPEPTRATLEATGSPAVVVGHHDALQRAFRNLIRNAVEAVRGTATGPASPPTGANGTGPGTIVVRVDEQGENVVVAILDDGPGIPAGLTEAIFEPDRTLKATGTGLGLAIVRQVTAAHGGSVRARNRDSGHGAEFTVTLPKRPRGALTPQPRGSA